MTKMDDFTLNELMIFSISIIGAIGGLLAIAFKSRCETIDCFCFKCKRKIETDVVLEEEKVNLKKPPLGTNPEPEEEDT